MMEQIYLFAGFGAVPTSGEIYISPLLAEATSSQMILACIEQTFCVTMQVKVKDLTNQIAIRSEKHVL